MHLKINKPIPLIIQQVKTGGVLYYELGIARPDLVLKDIIKICHPELLEDYTTYFFKPLE